MTRPLMTVPGAKHVVFRPGAATALLVRHAHDLDRATRRANAWSIARELLAPLVGVAPSALAVRRSSAGKPRIDAAGAPWFNMSHAEAFSLIAVSLEGEVGCDIEDRLRPDDCERVGATVLHMQEARWLAGLPEPQREEMFARCWVRKEAVLKAAGTGFGEDPRRILVLDGSGRRRLESADGYACIVYDRALAGTPAVAAVACADAECDWFELGPG